MLRRAIRRDAGQLRQLVTMLRLDGLRVSRLWSRAGQHHPGQGCDGQHGRKLHEVPRRHLWRPRHLHKVQVDTGVPWRRLRRGRRGLRPAAPRRALRAVRSRAPHELGHQLRPVPLHQPVLPHLRRGVGGHHHCRRDRLPIPCHPHQASRPSVAQGVRRLPHHHIVGVLELQCGQTRQVSAVQFQDRVPQPGHLGRARLPHPGLRVHLLPQHRAAGEPALHGGSHRSDAAHGPLLHDQDALRGQAQGEAQQERRGAD
mmetsp:Transcript_18297/g.50438  ORF Transcript_18297/g.50438 Transcript_18297/m.50438 type:complete len:257 (+) Transcript_18297:2769-3539(+)